MVFFRMKSVEDLENGIYNSNVKNNPADISKERKMQIIKLTDKYKEEVFGMMKVFYASSAVIHKSSEAVLTRDINDCIADNPFIEGYVFKEEDDVIGYSMVSKNYTTEYGGLCIWIEDLYFKEQARGKGYAAVYFRFLEDTYREAVRFKLEVEAENTSAIEAYHKSGYEISEYHLMTKEMDKDLGGK